MFITHDVKQGSDEWLALRAGVPTASEFKNLVESDFAMRTGQMPKTYLHIKLAEKWLGAPIISFTGGGDMEQGTLIERVAIPSLQAEFEEELEGLTRVGFLTTEDKRIGCSPDALLPVGGLEVKGPRPPTHVGYLLSGRLPAVYAPQVHGAMLVTGAPHWYFASFCPSFPPFFIKVMRDEKLIGKLRDALELFNVRLDAGYAMMLDLNGGPPVRNKSTVRQVGEMVVRTMAGVDEDSIDAFLNSQTSENMVTA